MLNSRINSPEPKVKEPKPYPKIMRSKDSPRVVLFSEYARGITIGIDLTDRIPNDEIAIGVMSNSWAMGCFEDVPDGYSITLIQG
jgi:hypothetical protein